MLATIILDCSIRQTTRSLPKLIRDVTTMTSRLLWNAKQVYTATGLGFDVFFKISRFTLPADDRWLPRTTLVSSSSDIVRNTSHRVRKLL